MGGSSASQVRMSPRDLKVGDRVQVRHVRGSGDHRSGRIVAILATAGSSLPFYKVRWDGGLESITPFGPDVQVVLEEKDATA